MNYRALASRIRRLVWKSDDPLVQAQLEDTARNYDEMADKLECGTHFWLSHLLRRVVIAPSFEAPVTLRLANPGLPSGNERAVLRIP